MYRFSKFGSASNAVTIIAITSVFIVSAVARENSFNVNDQSAKKQPTHQVADLAPAFCDYLPRQFYQQEVDAIEEIQPATF